MSELPPAQFRKTKAGKWAVMAPVQSLEAALQGDGKVDVLKKNGDWSKFTVGSLGKAFDVDGVSMCYGYAPGDEDTSGGSGGASQGGSGGGSRSGSRGGQGSWGSSAPPQEAPPSEASWANAPAFDDSEPLPEYQGGPEDEWQEF